MKIVGITGTLGSGKGTLVDYLVKKRGFKHFSVRDFLIQELKAKDKLINRPNMTKLANELREQHSASYIVEQLYQKALESGDKCIIESVRTVGEVEALRQLGNFTLIAMDADPRVRYDRVIERRSETDHISYEEFIEHEQKEMHSNNPNHQNLSKCIKMADAVIYNDDSIEELNRKIIKTFYDLDKAAKKES